MEFNRQSQIFAFMSIRNTRDVIEKLFSIKMGTLMRMSF